MRKESHSARTSGRESLRIGEDRRRNPLANPVPNRGTYTVVTHWLEASLSYGLAIKTTFPTDLDPDWNDL
jgi:hypothetical protein